MDVRKRLVTRHINEDDSPRIAKDVQPLFNGEKTTYLYSPLGNVTPGDAFANCGPATKVLSTISTWLSHYWWHCLDELIALFIHTTENLSVKRPLYSVMGLQVIGYLFLLILLIPPAIFSLLIWIPLQFLRSRPFSYHISEDAAENSSTITHDAFSDEVDHSSNDHGGADMTNSAVKTYTVLTSNVCLMPEFLAKLNNVSNTVKRAEKMARLLCGLECRNNKVTGNSQLPGPCQWETMHKEDAVSENFSSYSDFLCLQEVFDRRAANKLLKGLGSKYPYIIYDVAWPLQKAKIKLLNSGLCIASRFPFLDVDFKAFPDGYREDQLACKGLLMTKINLGRSDTDECQVGYLATTHLQALTHSKASEVRCKQLDLLRDWLHQFKTSMQKPNDVVMFDIICGDFNFDQESHYERNERMCDFRNVYRDPCLDASGQQYHWVIGTELKAAHVHDPAVNHASGLRRMALSESERPRYVASTLPENLGIHEISNGKRRIDYILYQKCQMKRMVIKDYKFVTGFAALTDHIPVTMSFSAEG